MLKNQIFQMFLLHKRKIIYSHAQKTWQNWLKTPAVSCQLKLQKDALADKAVVAEPSTALSKQKGHLVLRQKALHTQITLYFEKLRYIQI